MHPVRNPPMSDPELLTVSQVCQRYPGARGAQHVTRSTVNRWIIAGCPARDGTRVRLAATRIGRRWLIRPADLDAFENALGADPATPSAPPTPTRRKRAAQRADEQLRRMGY